jgi:enoyl-CoA hydratase/carnithine racemase
MSARKPASLRIDGVPPSLEVALQDEILFVALNRPAKRNALDDAVFRGIHVLFSGLPESVRAVVIRGNGEHFCAGLDLASIVAHTAAEGAMHSLAGHRAFDAVQFGRVPVVAVMHGAVVGCGLELAAAAHVRVAEPSAFYALPEGQRGIFVGGGGAVRLPRLIGVSRMTEMMLTGRVYAAEEGHALGISHYLVPAGKALAKGIELARAIAKNAPVSNFAIMHALPRIAEMGHDQGMFMESLVAGITASEPAAKQRLKAFLEKRAAKVKKE